jgi:hypothetical protein
MRQKERVDGSHNAERIRPSLPVLPVSLSVVPSSSSSSPELLHEVHVNDAHSTRLATGSSDTSSTSERDRNAHDANTTVNTTADVKRTRSIDPEQNTAAPTMQRPQTSHETICTDVGALQSSAAVTANAIDKLQRKVKEHWHQFQDVYMETLARTRYCIAQAGENRCGFRRGSPDDWL